MQPYRARLRALSAERGALCVGIDPHPHLLRQWGLEESAAGAESMARQLVDALSGSVAVFKPQAAFFEIWGSAGVAALERVLADIRQAGALSILDAKRGDIGSTMGAYAQATLAEGAPLECDALTVSPYLGFGALQPAVELATKTGRGLYVLCRTSNPHGGDVQLATTPEGPTVAQDIVAQAQACNNDSQLDVIGLVIGATRQLDVDLDGFSGSLLVPGVGAQGGRAEDLPGIFGDALPHVVVNSSREIIGAGPDPDALRAKAASALNGCPSLQGVQR